MIGPLMQGVVLMSIIYWYSKSMMHMINEYYRSEFERKLQAGEGANDTPRYDVENLDQLMKVINDNANDSAKNISATTHRTVGLGVDVSKKFNANVCHNDSPRETFMQLLVKNRFIRGDQHLDFCWIT